MVGDSLTRNIMIALFSSLFLCAGNSSKDSRAICLFFKLKEKKRKRTIVRACLQGPAVMMDGMAHRPCMGLSLTLLCCAAARGDPSTYVPTWHVSPLHSSHAHT